MVIDTSAVVAVVQDEPARRRITEALDAAETGLMSTVSFVECSIILEVRHGEAGHDALDLFIAEAGIEHVPVDAEQARVARRALNRFSKGRHPAG